MDFPNLWMDTALIRTDSGGPQEETTVPGLPCLTLRQNTERPITCDQGTNRWVLRRSVSCRRLPGFFSVKASLKQGLRCGMVLPRQELSIISGICLGSYSENL